MHECPECGQACDCDGEDTWFDNATDCACACWQDDRDEAEFWRDDEDDDYGPIYEEWEWVDSWPLHRRILYRVRCFIDNLREGFKRCPDCGKFEYFAGRRVGKHEDCMPF